MLTGHRNFTKARQEPQVNGLVIHVRRFNDRSTEVVMRELIRIGAL